MTLKALLGAVGDLIQGGQTDKSKGDQAVILASEVYSTAKREFGTENPITLEAMQSLAFALGESFRFKEQRTLLEAAIPLHETTLGKSAPATIDLLIQLSANCRFFCENSKSAELARTALARSDNLRADHPLRYSAKQRLSAALSVLNGSEIESRRLADENRDFAIRVYGREHWKTFDALDACIMADFTYPGAAVLAAETYSYALKRYGPKHRRTLKAQRSLALVYSRDSKTAQKAEELYLAGLNNSSDFHRHDPSRLNYLFQTGYFYSGGILPERRNLEKAESYYLEAADTAREAYGDQCWPHFQALNALRYYYRNQKNWRKAAEFNERLLNIEKQIENQGVKGATGTAMQLVQCFLELDEIEKADALMQVTMEGFLKQPPHSDGGWEALKPVINATEWYPGRDKLFAFLDQLLSSSIDTPAKLGSAALYHRIARQWKMEHQTWQKLTVLGAGSFDTWHSRSATAINTHAFDDHLACSREMLRRFTAEPDDMVWSRVLRSLFLIPSEWSSEELAQAQKIYDWLSKITEKDDRPSFFRVRDQGSLALADVRRGRFQQALEHLAKADLAHQPPRMLHTLHARIVEALAYGELGEFQKASESLLLSDAVLWDTSSYIGDLLHEIARLRLLYLEAAEKLIQMGKTQFGIRHAKTTLLIDKLAHCSAGIPYANASGRYVAEAANAIRQTPPQSDEDWDSVRNLINATKHFEDKNEYLAALTRVIANAPTNSHGLLLAADFYSLTGDWPACHKAYQSLTRELPNDEWHWYRRSASAIASGDTDDHIHCARQLLMRFSRAGLLLKTAVLTPHAWSSDELAQIQSLYDQLESKMSEASPRDEAWHRGELALADVRLKRYQKALMHIKKLDRFDPDSIALPNALALSVAALCYAQLGQVDQAKQALGLSDKALRRETPLRRNFDDVCRRDHIYREAAQVIQSHIRDANANGGSGTSPDI